jgi:hypothetical protein
MEGYLEARPGVLLLGALGVGKRTILSREISLPPFIFLIFFCLSILTRNMDWIK